MVSVTIKGRGDHWKASITARGQRVLNGTEALFPKTRTRGTTPHLAAVPRTKSTPKATPKLPPLFDVNQEAYGLITKVETAEFHVWKWEGSEEDLDNKWRPIIAKARKIIDDRDDSTVLDHRYTRPSYSHEEATVHVGLVSVTGMRTPMWKEMAQGEKKIRTYHAAVKPTIEWRKGNLTKAVIPRARRLLHVLYTETEARGGTVKVSTGFNSYTKTEYLEKVEIRKGHFLRRINIKELNDRFEREPTQSEIDDYTRWYRDRPMKEFYDYEHNGLLEIDIEYHATMKDTKLHPDNIVKSIERYFFNEEIADFWQEYNDEQQRRREALQKKKQLFAEEFVHREVVKNFYFEELSRRAERWKRFDDVQHYLDALRSSEPSSKWLGWATDNLEDFNPMNDTSMPSPPQLNLCDVWEQVRGIIERLSDDPNDWNENGFSLR